MAAPKRNAKAGGRKAGVPNKATREIKEIAQLYGVEAIERAVTIMRHARTPATVKLMAIDKILDRAYGKPTQTTEIGNKPGEALAVSSPTDDRVKAALALMMAREAKE